VRLAESPLSSSRPGPIFYRPNVGLLYIHFDFISRHYPGWNLTEIKGMTERERRHWVDSIKWRNERQMLNA